MPKRETIWVKPANPRAGVVLWQPDTEHPRNEAWIAGDALARSLDDLPASEVGRTAEVDKLLRDGDLIEVKPTQRDRDIAANTPHFPAGALDYPAGVPATAAGAETEEAPAKR